MDRIPKDIKVYVEVFTGAGWVFFFKKRLKHKEILNDYNGLLTNLHICVRDKLDELLEELENSINARDYFNWIKERLKAGKVLNDVKRAANYFELIKYSYSSSTKSFAGVHTDITKSLGAIEKASERLKGVMIENLSFEDAIQKYDEKGVFFYLDPPYYETESFYQNVGKEGFTFEKHILLRDVLSNIKGRFLLSYNDCEFIRELYNSPNFYIEGYERPHNLRQRYEKGAVFKELLISNYNVKDVLGDKLKQMELDIA